jgi:hypothetical protein
MSRKYDRTDLEVFASDVQKLAVKIEASINGGRKKAHNPKVTWKQIEDLNAQGNPCAAGDARHPDASAR